MKKREIWGGKMEDGGRKGQWGKHLLQEVIVVLISQCKIVGTIASIAYLQRFFNL